LSMPSSSSLSSPFLDSLSSSSSLAMFPEALAQLTECDDDGDGNEGATRPSRVTFSTNAQPIDGGASNDATEVAIEAAIAARISHDIVSRILTAAVRHAAAAADASEAAETHTKPLARPAETTQSLASASPVSPALSPTPHAPESEVAVAALLNTGESLSVAPSL
jgi:hypothetical protein